MVKIRSDRRDLTDTDNIETDWWNTEFTNTDKSNDLAYVLTNRFYNTYLEFYICTCFCFRLSLVLTQNVFCVYLFHDFILFHLMSARVISMDLKLFKKQGNYIISMRIQFQNKWN